MPSIYSSDGTTRLGHIDAEPVCGRDFCDNCGDCIYCYGDDCNTNDYCGGWMWVLYEGSDDELIAELRAASASNDEDDAGDDGKHDEHGDEGGVHAIHPTT